MTTLMSTSTRRAALDWCLEQLSTKEEEEEEEDDEVRKRWHQRQNDDGSTATLKNAAKIIAKSSVLSFASELETPNEMERVVSLCAECAERAAKTCASSRPSEEELWKAVRGVGVIRCVMENVSTDRFAKIFVETLKTLDATLKAAAKTTAEANNDSNGNTTSSEKRIMQQLTVAVVKCIEVIAKRTGALSEHMPGVKHDASQSFGKILRSVLALLDDDQGETTEFCDELEIGVLECFDAICTAHPGSAKQHVSNLQKRIKMYLGSASHKRSYEFPAVAARCFASILRASGGTKELTGIWQSTMHSALVQAHALAKQAFDGFEKLEVAEKGLKMLIPVGYDTPAEFLVHTKYQTQERLREDAQDVLDAILLVCTELLNLKEFPVPVSVPLQPICELAKRILKCNGTPISQSPGLPPGMLSPRLSAKLPNTHEKALLMLNATISATKITFTPTCSFACIMLDDCLRNTAANDRTGEVTNASVRCAAYDVSMNLANTLGAGAVKSFICDSIARHAIEDAAATFTTVSFSKASSAKQHQSKQQRKRKKHGAHGIATEQDPDVLREIASKIDNVILLAGGVTASNRVLTSTAALKCLATILRVGGAYICGSARRAIDDVVAAAYESNCIVPSNLYRDKACVKMLDDFKAAKTEALLASTLAPTSHRPRNSALTFASFANTCNVTSVDARVALESLIHPSAPPLLERASNSLKNATKDEKVKWSLTNETNRYNTDDAKPTWDDDDDDDGDAEEDKEEEEEDKEENDDDKQEAMDDGNREEESESEAEEVRCTPPTRDDEEEENEKEKEEGTKVAPNANEKVPIVEDEEFGAFGVPVNSEKLRTSDDAWVLSKAPKKEEEEQPKKKKFGKSSRKQAVAEDSDSDGALPDIVFGDEDEEEEDALPAKKKTKKSKR